MQDLPLSLVELLEIVLYFSSLVLFLGIIFQFLLIFLQDKKLSVKLLWIIVLTQFLVIIATTLLWLKWPMGLRILYGPILFPAIIAEVVIVPIISNFFRYRISFRKKKN